MVRSSEGSGQQDLRKRLESLYKEARLKGLSHEVVCEAFKENKPVENGTNIKTCTLEKKKKPRTVLRIVKYSSCIVAVIGALVAAFAHSNGITSVKDAKAYIFEESPCLVSNNGVLMEVARPILSCDICKDLHEVPIERDITQEVFGTKYAYTSVPVLVKDATQSWTAMTRFSFNFIKELYTNNTDALKAVEHECQFFPYKTEFETLEEALNMSESRATFKEGEKPWYFGWSNCDMKMAKQLRTHYQKPYFLPRNSESSDLDWLFMGGSGQGAFIHLDYVEKPSWQAQISGMKTWTLVPVPECENVCHSMNVTVHKGDIIVINTNNWYHSTFIHPGEISITIGSEYD